MTESVSQPAVSLTAFLQSLFVEGRFVIGEILVREDWTLRHVADAAATELERFGQPAAAREICRYDEAGQFRALKTAPTLRRGWLLQLPDAEATRVALDFFYPAALGLLRASREGRLAVTPFRETLGRQTGMYRVTQKISDEQALEVIRATCNSEDGCLRRVLWPLDESGARAFTGDKISPASRPGEAPLLCRELCNLAVAACRKKVKETSG